MRISKEELRMLFRVLHSHSEYKALPISWNPDRRGPKLKVSRVGAGVTIQLNVSGLTIHEIHCLVDKALKHANDMHRGLTTASEVGIGHASEKHEGIPWAKTEKGRKEQSERELQLAKPELLALIDRWVEA